MANGLDEFNLQLTGELEQKQSKTKINSDLVQIASAIDKLKVQAEIDPNSVKNIAQQLANIINQKVVVDKIQIDTTQASKAGEQAGQNIGNSLTKRLQSSLNTVKHNIETTINSFGNQKLNSYDLSKMFNLNRSNIDASVIQNVRNLTNELNALAKEALKTNSDSSWEGIVNKISSLSRVLTQFGSGRDITAFKESLDVLDYFQNKKIFVGSKDDVLANTGLSVKELNNQFRNLGVTFTTVKEKSVQLDTVWEELFRINPNLQQFTNFGDQINAVVNHLKIAKEAMYGDSTLQPLNSSDVNKVLLDWLSNLENTSKKINVFRGEQEELERRLAHSSTSSTNTVVQNEQKKQQAYQQTANAKKKVAESESLIKNNANVTTFAQSNNAARIARDEFEQLLQAENAVISVTERFGKNNNLTSFSLNIKRATGEVETLRYALENIGDKQNPLYVFKNNGAELNNSGAIKQIQAIENAFADYTAKLAQFKSTNTNILSGLTTPLQDFESKLAGLKNGTTTIDEVKNAFKLLGTEASKITENFTGQLSKTDAAIRKLAQSDEIMDKLKASFKGLNNAPKEITKELNSVSKLLQNVKNIESKEGRTANWSAAYRKWADEVDKLQAKLSVLQKQQANMTTPQVFKTSELRNADIPYMTKVSNTIEKQMAEIQKMANAKGWQKFEVKGVEEADGKIKALTLTVRDAEGALKQFTMQRAKLQGSGKAQTGLMQVGDVKVLETASQAQAKLAQQTENANAKLQEQFNKIQLLSNGGIKNDYATQIAKLEGDFRSLGLAQDTIATKTQNVKNSLATLRAEFAKPVDQQNFQAIQTANDNLQRELIESRNEFEQLRASMKGMATEQQRLSLANTIEAWNQKNTAATKTVREENERYVITLRDLNTQMTRMQLGQINTAFKQTENSMRALNKLGASVINQLKQGAQSFTTWLSASTMVMKTISETREAITNIKELDNILTEISKTSDMTAESLEKLGMKSYDTASKYGRTSKDYLSAFESMARSGFYGKQGESMAEQSLLAQAAGDMSQEIADKYILATNAAYKFNGESSKLNAVLDGMNLITNRNSVALEDMASAMSKAGTTAASYNVSVEDLSAMIGTMEAVTKSGGDEVGNSLKSILINLQNVTSSKITGTLDEAGASMTTFVNGVEKLRNPIEILRDLAKTFTSLDEDDPLRAEILTNIGGKYQANKLAALLNNMELFDKMLVDYSEGSGSALEEASKSANNLTGRLNALQNSWNELVNSLVTSEGLKSGVNFLNGLVQGVTELTSTLGALGTVGLGAGLFAGIKNVGQAKMWACLIYAYPC